MIKISKIGAQLVAIAMVAAVFTACSEKKDKIDLSGRFTFVKGVVTLNNQAAKVGQKVNASDVIEVKDNSGAVVQFSNRAVVSINSGSRIEVSRLMAVENGVPAIELLQTKGSTFNKVTPGQSQYKISTPTAVAGVRGTSFQVQLNDKNQTQILLLNGKVAVNTAGELKDKAQTISLEAGQKVVTDDKGIVAPVKLTETETQVLTSLNKIDIVEDEVEFSKIESKENGMEIAKDIEAVLVQKQDTTVDFKTEVPVKKLTLDDLKAKYGKLSKVETKDGKTYIGHFSQSQGKMSVVTVDGVVSIDSGNIKKVSQY